MVSLDGSLFDKRVSFQKIGALPKRQDFFIAAAIFAVFLTIYLLTLYPEFGGRLNFGDSAKFQYLGLTWYPPHPTGYPLYMLINKAISCIPLQVPQAIKINALSAVFGALTSALVFLLSLAVSGGRLPSVFSSTMFSLSSMVWMSSTEAEITSLNSLFVTTSILLMVYWSFSFCVSHNSLELSSGAGQPHPSIQHSKTGLRVFLYAGLAVYIMGFSHHATMITMLPGFLFIIWVYEKRDMASTSLILWCFLWGLAVLSLYGVYFIKIPRMLDAPPDAMEPVVLYWDAWIINNFLGTYFRSSQYMFAFTLKDLLFERIPLFLRITQREFGWFMIFVGLTGIIGFTQKYVHAGLFLILCAAGQIFWALNYNISDIDTYFIPAFFVICVFCSYAIQTFAGLSRRAPRRYRKPIKATMFLFFFCVVLIHSSDSYKTLVKNTRSGLARAQYIRDLARIIPRHSAIERGSNYYFAEGLQYIRYVEQDRKFPDFIVIHSCHIPYAKWPVYSFEHSTYPDHNKFFEYEEISTPLAHWLSQWGPSHVVVISIKDEGTIALDDETISALRRFGLQVDLKDKYRWSYIGVAQLGKGSKEILEPRKIQLMVKSGSVIEGTSIIARKMLKVTSAGFETGNISEIYVGSVNLSYNRRGMNIVILDESDFSLVDRVSADTYAETKVKKLFRVKLKSAQYQ